MHTAMATAISTSTCVVNPSLASRDAPRGLHSASLGFTPIVRSSRFGSKQLGVAGGWSRVAHRVRASDDSKSSESKNRTTKTEENVPGWAKPGSEELPPWARSERPASQEPAQDVPFFVYLIGSSLVAIAAIGSIFEYFNKNAIFGVVEPDSPLWAPILGFFAITGLPSAGFLFYKSISLANKAAADLDKEDGFLDR